MADIETTVKKPETNQTTTIPDATQTTSTISETKELKTPENNLSAEDQVQQMRVELAKLKKAQEKAASEAADYKRQLRTKQTQEEADAQEKAEKEAARQEEFDRLLKENTVTKLAKNYLSLGYPQELAEKAASAQYDNDTDELFKIQSTYQSAYKKSLEAEWLKTRPTAQSGASEDDGFAVTKEQFDGMTYLERLDLKNKHPKIYENLAK